MASSNATKSFFSVAESSELPNTSTYLDLLLHIALFAPLLPRSLTYLSQKFTTRRGYPYPPMVIHLVTPLFLLARYHASILQAEKVTFNSTDLLLATLFVSSAILIEEFRAAKQSAVYRATFRTAYVLHAITFGLAFFRNDVMLWQSGIKFLTWFAAFRWILQELRRVPELKVVANHHRSMEIALVFSVMLSLWYAGLSLGWYTAGILAVLRFDRWLSPTMGEDAVKDAKAGEK